MTATEQRATVLRLACETEHRTKGEQRALEAEALRIDRAINKQSTPNPHMPKGVIGLGTTHAPACTYSTDHPKTCACRGDRVAVEPTDGWSRLAELVADSWRPS